MPLKCLSDSREIYAFDIGTDAAWELLKTSNATSKFLKMPCCNANVVLRRSKLGTRHFAHARRGDCQTAPESAEHLLAKTIVVEGIKATSWVALPEQAGETPSGEAWRADVLAVKGKAKVAFEIQWSRQTDEDTKMRQKRYSEAGVRGLWLFKQKDIPVGHEIPSFRLVFDPESKGLDVLVPSADYHPLWISRRGEDLRYWSQKVPLARFVSGALTGRLRFAPVLDQELPVDVDAVYIECWRCHRKTGIVMGLLFAASRVFPGCTDIPVSIYDMGEISPDGAADAMKILPPALLKQYGIGAVKPRWSKTQQQTYLSNGCVHCDALQGRFFEHELAFEAQKAFETFAVFQSTWSHKIERSSRYVNYWWFDERQHE